MLIFTILVFLFTVFFWVVTRQKKEINTLRKGSRLLVERVSILEKEKKARKEELKSLKDLFDKEADLILEISSEGKIIFANQGAIGLFPTAEIWGRKHWEVIRNEKVNEIIARVLKDGRPQEEKVEFFPERKTFQLSVYPIQGGVLFLGRDVTEEEKLAEQRRTFTANISHELRSPIANLGVALETMRGYISEEGQRFYTIAHRQIERLAHLVRDLLTLTEVERGFSLYKFEPVELPSFIEEFLSTFYQRAQKKEIVMVTEFPEGLPKVKVDRHRLEQVLENLLDNALKYTPEKGMIKISASWSGNVITVKVSDTGIGIPAEDLPHIFERFYRVDKDRSRQMGGTGLGLAIVRHIVQAFGGKVWVESEVGKGSTFYFTLPLFSGSG